MENLLKVDKKYLKSFNLGYEVAKELDLKKPMFDTKSKKEGVLGQMEDGMLQFLKEKGE